MDLISGFLVVRKPQWATATFHQLNNQIDGKIYHGVDRLPWEDIDTDYYAGKLQTSLIPIRKKIEGQNKDLIGLNLLQDYDEALEVHRAYREKTDVLSVYSPELAQIKGCFSSPNAGTYIGIDCFCFGEWSIILRGIYVKPEYFTRELNCLNSFGLFQSNSDCPSALSQYLQLASRGLVEPLREGAVARGIRVFSTTAGAFS
jgi:hypothetical protein